MKISTKKNKELYEAYAEEITALRITLLRDGVTDPNRLDEELFNLCNRIEGNLQQVFTEAGSKK